MEIREIVYKRMNDDTELKSLVDKIYSMSAPENAGDTIITYSRLAEKSYNKLICIVLYQISIRCKDIIL
jgi:hypothetical protein